MSEERVDVAVIGAGPGGYVAAIRAAQLGKRVAVIEREHLGGICLNWGCIPTKAMLRSAEVFHLARRARDFGLVVEGIRADLEGIVARARKVAGQLSSGVAHLLKKNGVRVIMGRARLLAPGRIGIEAADGASLTVVASDIILATGARARELPGMEADGACIWTYKHALAPKRLPKRLLVIGAGAIGIEFASFYAALGAETTVVEVLDRILPAEDAEISALAKRAFQKQGMTIREKTTVTQLDRVKEGVIAHLRSEEGIETLAVDTVISAVGIVGNVEDLGLEALGVRVEKTHVMTDALGRTGVPGLWAIGDVAGPPWLAHKASHEGVMVAEAIAGLAAHPLHLARIPGCTFCHPEIASIGLTEEQARASGRLIRVGRFSLLGNGKALALGEPEGLVKTIFDAETGELLGAHMIGPGVTEMIQGFAIALGAEVTEAELMATVFPHPTVSEAMHESVLAAYGRVLHL